MVPAGKPDHRRARRRLDVRRRYPGGAAPDDAAGRDDRGRRALRLSRRHVGTARPDQSLPRGHDVRHCRARPAGGRRRTRHPRPRPRHDAGRHAVRRERPAPADLGAHRRDPELPARPPTVRRPPARPGRVRRVRRASGVRLPEARGPRPAHDRGGASCGGRAVPARAPGDRPRARRGLLPDPRARAPPRRAPAVPGAGRRRRRPDAGVDAGAAGAADAAAGARPGRRRPRPGRHPHGPLGDGERPRAHCPAPRATAADCSGASDDSVDRARDRAQSAHDSERPRWWQRPRPDGRRGACGRPRDRGRPGRRGRARADR